MVVLRTCGIVVVLYVLNVECKPTGQPSTAVTGKSTIKAVTGKPVTKAVTGKRTTKAVTGNSTVTAVTNKPTNVSDDQDQGNVTGTPWLNGTRFQGDIDGFDQAKFDALIKDLNKWQRRRQASNQSKNITEDDYESAMSDPRSLWPHGRVPYVFASSNPELHQAMNDAFNDFHSSTCLKFFPRTNEPNYLQITANDDGCHATMGCAHQGPQNLNLGQGCKTKGIASHELMHAIGFWHEQQRTDRDDHIIVTLANVIPKYKDQYLKAKTEEMNLIGNYDMSSVMHYPTDGFALPGKQVMRAKHSQRTSFGGPQMSNEDKRKIRLLYRCDGLKERRG